MSLQKAWRYGELRIPRDYYYFGSLRWYKAPSFSFYYWALAIKRWVLKKICRYPIAWIGDFGELDRIFNSYRPKCKLCGERTKYFIDCIWGFEGGDGYTPIALYLYCPKCKWFLEIEYWGL